MNDKGKKILILGNGFDLAHGLPTRYSDFLEFCLRVEKIYCLGLEFTEYNNTYIDNWIMNGEIKNSLLEAFKTRQKNTIFLEGGMSNNIVTSANSAIQEMHECLTDNVWYNYLRNLFKANTIKGENWIDFESEISLVIQEIDKYSNNLSKPYNGFFKKLDNEDIDDNTISDKLKSFREIINKIYKVPERHEITIKVFREKCCEDLEKLTRALELYLAAFVEKLTVNLRSKDIEKIKPDYVINFNYTNTFAKYYGEEKNIFYIHGKCKESNSLESNNMVLGIDEYWSEEERDKHTNFTIFKKFAQRIRKKTGIENYKYLNEIYEIYEKRGGIWSGNVDKKNTHTDGTTLVYVFGHSLDITDKDILFDFFENEATAVTIYCRNKGTEGELLANMIKIISEKRLLQKVNQAPSKIEFIIQKDMVNKI